MDPSGLEPLTFAMSMQRSNQLSYGSILLYDFSKCGGFKQCGERTKNVEWRTPPTYGCAGLCRGEEGFKNIVMLNLPARLRRGSASVLIVEKIPN